LRAITIGKGELACASYRAKARDVARLADTRVVLETYSPYTVDVSLDLADFAERRIDRIVSASWMRNDSPREFACSLPEPTMLHEFRTPSASQATLGPRLAIAVYECDSRTRTQRASRLEKTFDIEWRSTVSTRDPVAPRTLFRAPFRGARTNAPRAARRL
jgi:hypothetical protein